MHRPEHFDAVVLCQRECRRYIPVCWRRLDVGRLGHGRLDRVLDDGLDVVPFLVVEVVLADSRCVVSIVRPELGEVVVGEVSIVTAKTTLDIRSPRESRKVPLVAVGAMRSPVGTQDVAPCRCVRT